MERAAPELAVVTKAELPGAAEVRDRLASHLGRKVLLISAVTGLGLNELVSEIGRLLSEQRDAAAAGQ